MLQVQAMLQSVLSLDSTGRTEVMGYLKECALNYGLVIPNEKEGINCNNITKSYSSDDNVSTICQIENTPTIEDKNCDSNSDECNLVDNDMCPNLNESEILHDNVNFNNFTQLLKDVDNDITSSSLIEKTNVKECLNENENVEKHQNSNNNQTLISDKMDSTKSINSKNLLNDKKENKLLKKKPARKKRHVDTDYVENENSIFKCPGCMTTCETKSALLQHFTTHGKSPLSCKLCRSTFNSILLFWKHQKKKECKLSLLKCSECDEKFKYRRHYLKHILGHNDNNCRYCEEKFSTWALYKNHLKEKHPDIKMERDLIPCRFCAMSFRRHLGLYNHYQVEHSKGKFVCLSCGLLLPTKEKFKEHSLVHESEKIWKCKICKMKFYRRQQLLFHVSVHKSGTYKCLTCDITVTSKVDLYKHKKDGHEVKGPEPKFECEICHKVFKKNVVLKNHMATHSLEKKYYCKYCVKSFRTMDALQKHEKRKSHFEKAKIILPESKYEKVYEDKLICESCGKQYKTQRELTWHLRVHKSIYECDECKKTFTLKVNLTKHIRLHRNKVCVVCELCGNTFNQLSALNEHILMKHSDVRNAECQVCKKKFKRKSELNRHMRIHEQKRPFVCFCGTAFKQSSHLQTHYKTFHEKNNHHQNNLMQPENFPQHPGNGGVYDGSINDRSKSQMYVSNGDEQGEGELLSLENLETDFRNANTFGEIQVNGNLETNAYGLRYPHEGDMDPINVTYEELNFDSGQSDKRELVFTTSPAIDLSMVTISEVVENGMTLEEEREIVESVESFNKLPDDASNLQLVNLSDHIVQEYLLNLP